MAEVSPVQLESEKEADPPQAHAKQGKELTKGVLRKKPQDVRAQ